MRLTNKFGVLTIEATFDNVRTIVWAGGYMGGYARFSNGDKGREGFGETENTSDESKTICWETEGRDDERSGESDKLRAEKL